MQNPFEFESRYILPYTKLTARFDHLASLTDEESSITCGVYGLFGSGKTSFLKSYFSPERCQAFAKCGQLYPVIMATNSPEPEQLFADICKSLADYTERYVPEKDRPVFPDADKEYRTINGRLEEMVTELRKKGYRVSLVLDEFHRISTCETIQDSHYNMFRNLFETVTTNLRYIVATDCDFDPQNKSHTNTFTISFFIHVFDDFFATAGGMTREEMDGYLAGFLPPDAEPLFTPEEVDYLYALTGGFPRIVRKTADIFYRLKCAEMPMEELVPRAGAELRDQFDLWCESLTTMQKALLRKSAKDGFESFYEGAENDAYDILKKRGFLVEEVDESRYGGFGEKRFCCELFKKYAEKNFEAEYRNMYGVARGGTETDAEEIAEVLSDARVLRSAVLGKIELISGDKSFKAKHTKRSFEQYLKTLDGMIHTLEAGACDHKTLMALEKELDSIQSKYGRATGWQ